MYKKRKYYHMCMRCHRTGLKRAEISNCRSSLFHSQNVDLAFYREISHRSLTITLTNASDLDINLESEGFLIAVFSFWQIGPVSKVAEFGRAGSQIKCAPKVSLCVWMLSLAVLTRFHHVAIPLIVPRGRCGKYSIGSWIIWLAETSRRHALIDNGCCPLSSTSCPVFVSQ